MRFTIVSHVPHSVDQNKYYAYAPYIREMNLWIQYVDELIIVAPLANSKITAIHEHYKHSNIKFVELKSFDFLSLKSSLSSIPILFGNMHAIYKAFKNSDHIHLRCPGNIGMLGAMVQVLFPKINKTTKYAGNWDPKAKQPLSYKFQRMLVSSAFWSKNMKVLVYGDWPNQSKNVVPFFTATYRDSEKTPMLPKGLDENIQLLFVGTLAIGKQTLYAIQIAEGLTKMSKKVQLSIYGEGAERASLFSYIQQHQLEEIVFLKGNVSKEALIEEYKNAHAIILASKSEGWPKVLAEAMFWGCLPIASPVSCVPTMLANEQRGILLSGVLQKDVIKINHVFENQEVYDQKINSAINWSRSFTIDTFEREIKKLLHS